MSRPILLFDVMDTLVHDPYFDEVLTHLGIDLPTLFAEKDKSAWFEFESALIDEATYFGRFWRDRRPLNGAALRDCVRSAYRWLDGMEELLGDLKAAGYEMHALSNYPSWFEMIDTKLGLGRFLEWTFVSSKTGVRKPDPLAYTGAAKTLGVATSDCLFIDDREHNCAAAREQGMAAIRFEDAVNLRRQLSSAGVL